MLIERIIIVEADHRIPHSREDTLLHRGPRDKLLNLLIPLKEHRCPLKEARNLDPVADLQAQTLLAAVAAQEVAGQLYYFIIIPYTNHNIG